MWYRKLNKLTIILRSVNVNSYPIYSVSLPIGFVSFTITLLSYLLLYAIMKHWSVLTSLRYLKHPRNEFCIKFDKFSSETFEMIHQFFFFFLWRFYIKQFFFSFLIESFKSVRMFHLLIIQNKCRNRKHFVVREELYIYIFKSEQWGQQGAVTNCFLS